VLDGALSSRGMASFRRFQDARDVGDLRAHPLAEARRAPPAHPKLFTHRR